ncbi:MAG: hypothetical protein ACRDJW_01740 [Thermomicrobiales bacterium]
MERIVHLVGALVLVVYIYAPWGNSPNLTSLVQFVVVPVLVGSGMAMWQLPRIRMQLKQRRMSSQRIGDERPPNN